MEARVPLPEYRPDQSNSSGVLLTANNVFPAIDGYRSVGSVVTISDALDEDFQGGGSAIASDGDAFLLAGTTSDIYRITSAGAWTSLLTGLSVNSRWKFETFKDLSEADYAICVNGTSTSYAVDLDAGTAAAITDMPGATSVAVIGDHVVIARPDGDISKVAWSAFGDHTGWTVGTNQAGDQPMRTGGPVQAIAGGEYGVILQRNRLVRMTLTGDPSAPFEFDEISANFGCADGNTVAQAGRTIFFISDRGFMALDDGQVLKPIGSEKVDRTFSKLVSRSALDRVYTAVDPQNKLVMWLVPGEPGTLWTYNFELDRWSTIELNAQGLFPGFTTTITTDDLSTLGYTYTDDSGLATLTVDDPRWDGGSPRLYLVNPANKIGNLSGTPLAAELKLGNSQFTPSKRARVRSVRPVWDGTDGMTLSLNAKARLGDANDITTASTLRQSGIVPVRTAGRYISTTVQIAAATDWTYILGLEFEFEEGGRR